MIRYESFTSFDLKNSKLRGYFKWWSNKTFKEPRMLNRTVKFFKENLIFAVFAFSDEVLIGAAGLIPCVNRHKEKMFQDEMLVVEFASNFVDSNFRDQHIGTELVNIRRSFCIERKLLAVIVTGSSEIKAILAHYAVPMKGIKKYSHIYNEVRICECTEEEKLNCKNCPLKDKAIWVFV